MKLNGLTIYAQLHIRDVLCFERVTTSLRQGTRALRSNPWLLRPSTCLTRTANRSEAIESKNFTGYILGVAKALYGMVLWLDEPNQTERQEGHAVNRWLVWRVLTNKNSSHPRASS